MRVDRERSYKVESSKFEGAPKVRQFGDTLHVSANARVGHEFLARRSWLIKNANTANALADAIIVDDNPLDTERLASAFRLIFGHGFSVRQAKTVAEMVVLLRDRQPDILIIDDNLSQIEKAETTLAKAQSLSYSGPTIIISGMFTRQRLIQLGRLNAIDIIHKDDLDSTRLREAILKINDRRQSGT
jgi:DNA-binding NtrC family response regulator